MSTPDNLRIRFGVVLVLLLVVGAQFVVLPGVEAQSGLSSVSDLCGSVPVADERPFTDVHSRAYGAEYVACLKHLGIVNGNTDGSFGLRDQLTRAQMGSFLARLWRLMSHSECPSGQIPFVDVAIDSVHYEDISCIYNLGIARGRSETRFDPDVSVSLSELSLFLWRMFTTLSDLESEELFVIDEEHPDVFRRVASNLELFNVLPDSEGVGEHPAIRAQIAVYVGSLWLRLKGYVSPSPPQLDGHLDRGLALFTNIEYDGGYYPEALAWSPDGSMVAFGDGYDGNRGLYVVTADGGERRQLTDEGYAPSWSPDGSKLVFIGEDERFYERLYVIGADGGNMYELAGQPDPDEYSVSYYDPVWSPDGTRITFGRKTHNFPNPDNGLYVVDADGGNLKEIWRDPSSFDPSTRLRGFQSMWSHDSKRIFFTDYDRITEPDSMNLWVVDADGKNPVKLGAWSSGSRFTSLSPDKRHLLLTTNRGLYMMDIDSGNRRRIAGWGLVSSAEWSPNGELIAVTVVHGEDFGDDLFVMRPDGTDVRQLTFYRGDEVYPAWSPDGDRIAYLSTPVYDASGNYDLFVEQVSAAVPFRPMSASVPQARPLTSNDVEDSAPAWSPDGSRIVFVRSEGDDDDTEIYVMAADGSNEVKLTNNNFDDHDPVWSPDSERIFFTRTLSYPHGASLHGDLNPYHVLHVMMADGSEERRIPLGGRDDLKVRSWSLSPDGHQIAFSAYSDKWEKTYVIKTDGSSGIRSLISHGEDYPVYTHYRYPMWSPDSKRIALHISHPFRTRSHDVHVINVDGSNPQPIATTGGDLSTSEPIHMAWSSSDRIALYFNRWNIRSDFVSIYTLKSDGSDLQQVIGSPTSYSWNPNRPYCPRVKLRYCREGIRTYSSLVWSPDGRRVAFIERVSVYGSNVLVANPDGSDLQQLTSALTEVSDVTWSPDGHHILFVSNRPTSYEPQQDDQEIYIVDVP